MNVSVYWFVEALKKKWGAFVSVSVAVFLLGIPCGCTDKSTNMEIPNRLSPGEMLLGSWEFFESSLDGVVTPVPENELFWYFIAPQGMCSLEMQTDGTYGPDLSGAFGVFGSDLIILPSIGDQINLTFEFSENSDTLQIWEHDFEEHELGARMKRIFDAPENEWCP